MYSLLLHKVQSQFLAIPRSHSIFFIACDILITSRDLTTKVLNKLAPLYLHYM